MQRISLQGQFLQDADKGTAIFERIKGLAVVSPFQFKDLVTYTKQLSAFSIPLRRTLYETTKNLADLSAGLGVGMDRLILAYGQVRSAAVLRGQELRQGFRRLVFHCRRNSARNFQKLMENLSQQERCLKYISARKVPFDMVRDINPPK